MDDPILAAIYEGVCNCDNDCQPVCPLHGQNYKTLLAEEILPALY